MKKKLATAKNEKDVENIYRAELVAAIKGSKITSSYGSDGLLEASDIRTLLEFKYDDAMKSKLAQCNVLIQVLYYLKKFEDAGEKLPTTIFVGDINECFALKTNNVVKYLAHKIDWTIAPSTANKHNHALLQAMVEDIDILPFVYNIDDNFDIRDAIQKIKDLSENVLRKVVVTEKNIETIFEYFNANVLGEKCKLATNERANLFVQLIINASENCLHPKKKNMLMTKGFGEVPINGNLFQSFFGHFEGETYSPKEKEKFTGFVDRLVEDVTRRRKGEFFTPTLFVDEAHKYIAKAFGENWKEEYVVWDCACGTGNLTRDYKFKELYMSTLEQSDIDTANQMGYNPEAVKFQYDFLNDGVGEDMFDESAMPELLVEAIESGKKVLFFINPPYATAGNKGTETGNNKAGVATTDTGTAMKQAKWGASAQNLYAQFLYRIWKFNEKHKNVKIAIFCPPLFMSGSSYKSFRENFIASFGFKTGFFFEARHFSDVAKGWGIAFSVFDSVPNNNSFLLDLLDTNNFAIQTQGNKTIYHTDNVVAAGTWLRQNNGANKSNEVPCLKSALSISDKTKKVTNEFIATLVCDSNSVVKNTEFVFLLSNPAPSNLGSCEVTTKNILRCTALFAARKCITGQYNNWKNHCDEYLAPNESHPEWEQFTIDSLVYSLFESKSNQSALRRVDYKGKQWDIKNEFFWLSRKTMLELAEQNNYDALYKDAKTSDERFVCKKLEELYGKLSPDAKAVFDAATDLLKKSIAMRKAMSEEHPEYHLDSFDAGYAQLKLVWKEYFKDEFEAFRKLYKAFEDRLRPFVYELGFLKQ